MTLCLCLGIVFVASAQQKLELTLDEAVGIALNDNPTIKVANLEIERYDYVRKQALSSLMPQVDASAQYALALRRQEMAQGLSFGGYAEGRTRIRFYPITGRTHQLRVHAAHAEGLNTPIVGDDIYGTSADRLMLHAETIEFEHPTTGEVILLSSKAEF